MAIKAKQVESLGISPAEARKQMTTPQSHIEELPELTAERLAALREAEEGFKPNRRVDGTVEDAEETTEPPTPSKAMDMIRQLSQDKRQLEAERDAALNVVERYRAKYGELDG